MLLRRTLTLYLPIACDGMCREKWRNHWKSANWNSMFRRMPLRILLSSRIAPSSLQSSLSRKVGLCPAIWRCLWTWFSVHPTTLLLLFLFRLCGYCCPSRQSTLAPAIIPLHWRLYVFSTFLFQQNLFCTILLLPLAWPFLPWLLTKQ